MAGTRGLNLSYGSLTCYATREKLRQLKHDNPEFWKELDEGRQRALADLEAAALEDEKTNAGPRETMLDDDSAVSSHQVVAEMMPGHTEAAIVKSVAIDQLINGVVATGEAESLDFCGGEEIGREVEEELGRGKRKRKANTLYSHRFWLSLDD